MSYNDVQPAISLLCGQSLTGESSQRVYEREEGVGGREREAETGGGGGHGGKREKEAEMGGGGERDGKNQEKFHVR